MGVSGPKERATFSISPEIKRQLEEYVPKSERSRFVEKAIAQSLRDDARKSLSEFLDEIVGTSTGDGNSTDYLRRKRMEWDGRPIDVLECRRQ